MLRLRLGLYGLATLAAALVISHLVGHSQTLPSPWQPVNITAVDRGVFPLGIDAHDATRAHQHALKPGDRMGRNGSPYREGRLIVKFRDGVAAASRTAALSQVSRTASLAAKAVAADFDIVNMDPGEDAEALAKTFAARADVEYAQPAYRVYACAADTFVPNDTLYSQYQWNLRALDLERGWAIQHGASASIVVAVVDTGMAYTSGTLLRHAFAFCATGVSLAACPAADKYPDLGNLTLPFARASDLSTDDTRFVAPWDFIWNSQVPLDMDGHGTHVSGTIGELTNNNFGFAGVAFNVRLMPVKVIDSDWDDIFNSPGVGDDSTVALGVRWAADHGANVINMSIGRSGTAGDAPAIESAVRYAVSKGCFVAIAAGNDGTSLPAGQVEVLAEIASRVPGAVSVAALDRQGNHASYSTPGSYVEVAAPGGDGSDYIYQQTLNPDNVETFNLSVAKYSAPRFDVMAGVGYQGTSMATPHVSGLAALLMAQGIKDPAAVEAALEQFATDVGAAGRDNLTGFGAVNARNTLRGLGLSK